MHSESEDLLLVNQNYLLEKQTGKGGWTYACIPDIKQDKHTWFGLLKVRGSIDGHEISNVHLMPMGNGKLILAVKAEIRRIIKKQEGDWVHIILYSQELPPVNQNDFIICLKEEPLAFENYSNMSVNEQQSIVEWIYSAKNDAVKVERIAVTLNRLAK